jgi:hypothetical protein
LEVGETSHETCWSREFNIDLTGSGRRVLPHVTTEPI